MATKMSRNEGRTASLPTANFEQCSGMLRKRTHRTLKQQPPFVQKADVRGEALDLIELVRGDQ